MTFKSILLIIIVIFVVIIGAMIGLPEYNVWQQGKSGEATLKEADYSRQTKVVEAQANLEAEKLNAESEVVRAGGVAKSNLIIKDSISEQYIRYLWVKTLDNSSNKQVIYIPTEGNLPITEANRLAQPAK